VEKSVDYYMSLSYAVELEPDGKGYRASVKDLPGCYATVEATDDVDELWKRLKEAQRERIEQLLERGEVVPEPAGTSIDPFWEGLPDWLDEQEAKTLLRRDGAIFFPLRVLATMWLEELRGTGLAEIPPAETPPRGGTHRLDQTPRAREGDLRPVRLGRSHKAAWVRFDGPRTGRGYRAVDLLDQPLRTEAAVVAALTVLEASVIRDADFERLCEALREHVKAHPELSDKNLEEVLTKLPRRWFSAQKDALDEGMKELSTEERKKRFGQSWKRWERDPRLWRRTLTYLAALLRHHRPDFDARPLEEQLELLDRHRKRVNGFLEQQRKHTAFVEYGRPVGLPKAVQNARDQVEASRARSSSRPSRGRNSMRCPLYSWRSGSIRKLLLVSDH
jgi:predicted RNase H-like HicB family nuclease